MTPWNLTVDTKCWALVQVDRVSAHGKVAPRLALDLQVRTPTERIETELHNVECQVALADEVLAEGHLIGEPARYTGRSCRLEAPMSRHALDYVTDRLAGAADVGLTLRWWGVLRVKWDPNASDTRTAADPAPGEWATLQLPRQQNDQQLQISRSDWYSRVLQPLGDGDYLFLEIAVPRGLHAAAWAKTLSLVGDAEKCFAMGDDAGVFSKLKGAFEALPGAPKRIFDALPEPKRTAVNAVVEAYVTRFLNFGRHVTKTGTGAGEFPVDRIDARYALDNAKLVLSYASKTIPAATTP